MRSSRTRPGVARAGVCAYGDRRPSPLENKSAATTPCNPQRTALHRACMHTAHAVQRNEPRAARRSTTPSARSRSSPARNAQVRAEIDRQLAKYGSGAAPTVLPTAQRMDGHVARRCDRCRARRDRRHGTGGATRGVPRVTGKRTFAACGRRRAVARQAACNGVVPALQHVE
jgi:hypothetical protein